MREWIPVLCTVATSCCCIATTINTLRTHRVVRRVEGWMRGPRRPGP